MNYSFGYTPPGQVVVQKQQHLALHAQNSADSGFDASNHDISNDSTKQRLFSPSQSLIISNGSTSGTVVSSSSWITTAQQQQATRDKCSRCSNQVYALERIGPVKGSVYHKICFKCLKCDRQLDLKTYYTNQINLEDRNIYCQSHAPKSGKGVFGADNIYIQNILNGPKLDNMQKIENKLKANIDGNAKHIVHARNAQTLIQHGKRDMNTGYNYPVYPNLKAREEIRKAQQVLEAKQRAEEDMLLQKFHEERKREEQKLDREVKEEWEKRLQQIQEQYEDDLRRKRTSKDQKEIANKYRQEQENLEKNMTLKRNKKREDAKRALIQLEQEATSVLVTKHSEEMLKLVKAKEEEVIGVAVDKPIIKTPPPPQPPVRLKRDLYDDPNVFEAIDEQAINVAESEQTSYTELIDLLTHGLVTDLEKARAIFRWITVKDLNAIEFGESLINNDSPLGLLRGIKYGTETYHTLFMRLCSYAGMHCVDIKGHSKSVGYEPGMKIQPGKFTNTWNAVLIDGEWRFVQCNWGARHLVMSKDNNNNNNNNNNSSKSTNSRPSHQDLLSANGGNSTTKTTRDKIKYQYDEHYFLPDPEEFILEFYPHSAEWQLLEQPITLDEFESLPFVRSLFFHYHLDFVNQRQAVILANTRGACDIKLRMPDDLKSRLAFHFHLRLANKDDNEVNGIRLERYVLHTIQDDLVSFNIHVPQSGEYFIEIFSSLVEADLNPFGQSFKLKCVCKYKIICEELTQRMHPLPSCASGEWGPMKAQRHFNILPLTHKQAIIETATSHLEFQFQLPKTLKIHGKLHNNMLQDLDKLVKHDVRNGTQTLILSVNLPEEGQFGLDLYARDPEFQAEKRTMSHCCKYLINFNKKSLQQQPIITSSPINQYDTNPSQVSTQVVATVTQASTAAAAAVAATMIELGPNREQLARVGMHTINHQDPILRVNDLTRNQIDLQFQMSKAVDFSFDLKYDALSSVNEASSYKQLKAVDFVKVKQYGYMISFMLNLPAQQYGTYLFTIYASDDQNKSKILPTVYTYLIKYETN